MVHLIARMLLGGSYGVPGGHYVVSMRFLYGPRLFPNGCYGISGGC